MKLTNTKVYDRNKVWELANKYLVGKGGVVKDEAAGFKLMQVVATQGEVGAQYNVGNLYKDGVGVQRNYSGAAYWYRKAAEQGHSRARSELGNLYLNGRGVPKSVIEGAAWIGLSSRTQNYKIEISGVTLSSGDKIKVQKRVTELFKKYGKTK
ncbi:sel1 repeat family protein [bacterium]|nr:sel1 repeat family protein [bacterium]